MQWPSPLSPESYEDVSGWLDILKREIGGSVSDRRKAQKDRIAQVVWRLNANATINFEDHGSYIWFRVMAPDGAKVLLPFSEDRDAEFYERLSEEEIEERLHLLSNKPTQAVPITGEAAFLHYARGEAEAALTRDGGFPWLTPGYRKSPSATQSPLAGRGWR